MNNLQATAMRPSAASAGTLLLVIAGLALYQLTSLVLGPQPARQLHLSLSVSPVEVEDVANPLIHDVDTVLGQVAAAVRPAASTPAPAPRYTAAPSKPFVSATRPTTVSPETSMATVVPISVSSPAVPVTTAPAPVTVSKVPVPATGAGAHADLEKEHGSQGGSNEDRSGSTQD